MKKLKLMMMLFIVIMSTSCKNGPENTTDEIKLDYLDSLKMEREAQERLDEFRTSLNWDTVGIHESGLIITDARFYKEQYSNYKSVKLKYKNVSGKRIKAIRFKWYGIDSFGDPTDCGRLTEIGFGGGFDDSGLGIGQSTYGIWSVYNQGGDKIVKAWPTEIAFEDGTKWKSDWSPNY
jgi:hypothetical protein